MMSMMQSGTMQWQLYRKPIKHLNIRVLQPDGRVRVSAPLRMALVAIERFVIEQMPWIKKQQEQLAKQPRQSHCQLLTGEYHYLWGDRYHLEVLPGRSCKIQVEKDTIRLYVTSTTSVEKKALVLSHYYRAELKNHITTMLPQWCHVMKVSPNAWGIKKMKTRWGSCNIQAKRIWLSLELAKWPLSCLEYVLVHELVHLFEPSHNARFKAYMDRFLPDWRDRRRLLNNMRCAPEGLN